MVSERPFYGPRTAATIEKAFRRLDVTTATYDFDSTYECWTVSRPAGWEDGTDVEADTLLATGVGQLFAQGPGGARGGEQVIHLESPYRFQTWRIDPDTTVAVPIDAGHELVIDETRLFRVDDVKRVTGEPYLMDVFVTELFNTPMPGGA